MIEWCKLSSSTGLSFFCYHLVAITALIFCPDGEGSRFLRKESVHVSKRKASHQLNN